MHLVTLRIMGIYDQAVAWSEALGYIVGLANMCFIPRLLQMSGPSIWLTS